MPYPSNDDLSVWRRACLVAESFNDELESRLQPCAALGLAARNATRVAALLAESNLTTSPENRLSILFQAAALNGALLDELELARALGQLPADECLKLREETCGSTESILELIRSLRPSD